jgi:integrase
MSFLVRPTAKGFRVIEETYTPEHKLKTVPETAWKALGFNPDMSVAEAKARAKQITAQSGIDSKKIVGATRRLALLQTEASAYLPAADVVRFEAELHDMYADNPYRLEITLRYWKAAQLAILELAVDPKDFRHASHRLLNYFKTKHWSHDYIKRITRVLNLWGSSVSRHRGSHYDPIPNLDSRQVQRINDSREDVEGVRGPAEPLVWMRLKNARDKFESEGLLAQWNWLVIATWFGLRPLEVDNLKKAKFWRVIYSDEHECDVLEVYQTKLTNLPRDKRWKPIAIFLKEQREAFALIGEGNFVRPLHKTLRRLFGEGIQPSSPRKAFTDLMLEKDVDIESVSTFLGHHSIDMTWRHYKSRMRFKLPKSS